jgi:hypothetical protein
MQVYENEQSLFDTHHTLARKNDFLELSILPDFLPPSLRQSWLQTLN